jgi:hypothetical protein
MVVFLYLKKPDQIQKPEIVQVMCSFLLHDCIVDLIGISDHKAAGLG